MSVLSVVYSYQSEIMRFDVNAIQVKLIKVILLHSLPVDHAIIHLKLGIL